MPRERFFPDSTETGSFWWFTCNALSWSWKLFFIRIQQNSKTKSCFKGIYQPVRFICSEAVTHKCMLPRRFGRMSEGFSKAFLVRHSWAPKVILLLLQAIFSKNSAASFNLMNEKILDQFFLFTTGSPYIMNNGMYRALRETCQKYTFGEFSSVQSKILSESVKRRQKMKSAGEKRFYDERVLSFPISAHRKKFYCFLEKLKSGKRWNSWNSILWRKDNIGWYYRSFKLNKLRWKGFLELQLFREQLFWLFA